MKPGARVLIAGCGYTGARAATLLQRRGFDVFGARRSAAALPAGVTPVPIDLLEGDLSELPPALDAVVWSVSPEPTEAGYRAAYVDGPARLLQHIAERGDPLARTVLVGSTSVWNHEDGRAVDEGTPPCPADFRGAAVLDGEQVLRQHGGSSVALRFSGIYGPGRARLIDRVAAGATPPARAVHSNRIWADDGAKAIVHALSLEAPAPMYVVTDDEPADLREVYAWLAEQLEVPLGAPSDAYPGRGGSKRCSNRLLRDSGLELEVPDFRAGYRRLLSIR